MKKMSGNIPVFHELLLSATRWTIRRQWYHAKDHGPVRLYDAGHSFPYSFTCPVCQQGRANIEVRMQPFLNFTSFYAANPPVDDVDWPSLGGAGSHYCFIQCSHCQSVFYIGIGYSEPNNGRDVFELHAILEVDMAPGSI